MNSRNRNEIVLRFREGFDRMQAAGAPIIAATSLGAQQAEKKSSHVAEQVARLLIPTVGHGILTSDQHVANVADALRRSSDATPAVADPAPTARLG